MCALTKHPIWILYGSHTGNSERLALVTQKRLAALGFETRLANLGSFPVSRLAYIRNLLLIVSTHGNGEPASQAAGFYDFLQSVDSPLLNDTRFSVLALGDTTYLRFCQAGKDMDQLMEKIGGTRIVPRVDCDLDYEEGYLRWWDQVLSFYRKKTEAEAVSPEDVNAEHLYTRAQPYEAKVLKKVRLSGNSTRETLHFELDLGRSGINYEPGDAIGVYGANSLRSVETVLELLKLSGNEEINTWEGSKKLKDAILSDFELTPLNYTSLGRYAELTGSVRLLQITSDPEASARYIYGRDVIDLLTDTPYPLSPTELISILKKNTARLYSVASDQRIVGKRVDILAAVVRYEVSGRIKSGLCSSYLNDVAHEELPLLVFPKPNPKFRLPTDNNCPIIMVGAGTGIAPYRAFMQRRTESSSAGKSWLFFGGRNPEHDFYYREEWLSYLRNKKLNRIDIAFSRAEANRCYVQDKMEENGNHLYEWLEDGAIFYVCGNARYLGVEVEQKLAQIIQRHGHMSREEAWEYVRYLQITDRYRSDLY